MRREIYFAYGYGKNKKNVCGNQGIGQQLAFWSGYNHVKKNAKKKNKSPMPVVIKWLYMCAGGFHNGSAAILISVFRISNEDFCTFTLEKRLQTLQN